MVPTRHSHTSPRSRQLPLLACNLASGRCRSRVLLALRRDAGRGLGTIRVDAAECRGACGANRDGGVRVQYTAAERLLAERVVRRKVVQRALTAPHHDWPRVLCRQYRSGVPSSVKELRNDEVSLNEHCHGNC